MMNDVKRALKDLRSSDLMATFFRGLDGKESAPINILAYTNSRNFIELSADGRGRVKLSDNPISGLYFDEAIGFSFIAPLIKIFGAQLKGNELVQEVIYSESSESAHIKIAFDNGRTLDIRFEDDEMYFELLPSVLASSKCW